MTSYMHILSDSCSQEDHESDNLYLKGEKTDPTEKN